MDKLAFYDKEGNSLNFNYNESLERYEGDILFHENSSDTFKTQGIYLFEKVSSFQYENQSSLTTKKFQLFNEGGFYFYRGSSSIQIDRIEPSNTESDYFSKWIYGKNFDSLFKKGSYVRFDLEIFEFSPNNRVYQVVSTKKGAVLIISSVDNQSFESGYSYNDPSEYIDKTLSGVNIIGIYDYLTPDPFEINLSYWNEYDFYNRIYDYRKINIINTQKNDDYRIAKRFDDVSVVTVKKSDIVDSIHYDYYLEYVDLIDGEDLIIEIFTKTDLPMIYSGEIVFNSSGNSIEFPDGDVPRILKPGVQFQVKNSSLNNIFLNVSNIQSFAGNTQQTFYDIGTQVIFNNKIYECIQSYTWSGGSLLVNGFNSQISISPVPGDSSPSSEYWGEPTYIPVIESLSNETLLDGHIYLTTDHIYYTQSFTQSSIVTLASAADRYNSDFYFFGINLYYRDDRLVADLNYSSQYVEINFYSGSFDPMNIVGTVSTFTERLIETYEDLTTEYNTDISENFNYNIVITDIDEYGLVIKINDMVYQSEVIFLYSSGEVDLERTIDRTLRNWITKSFLSLVALGLLPTLITVGSSLPYYNAINLKTEYPNVPLEFLVQVGSTAEFFIEHSLVVIYDIGSYFSITINGRSYGESFSDSIPNTLQNWVNTWEDIINDFGIFVTNQASSLKFNVKNKNQRVDLVVNVGKSSLPGIDLYRIIKILKGNHGALLTSNEILEPDTNQDLEGLGFSTGMAVGINQTFFPLQNIEFNVLFLDPNIINLSYEGPFWGLSSSACSVSAMSSISFNVGFGQTACVPAILPDLLRGMYDREQFSEDYSIEYIITIASFSSISYNGVQNMVDIEYAQPSNFIYVLGDTIGIFDSITGQFIDDLIYPNASAPIEIRYNPIDGYIYALTEDYLYQIDSFTNIITGSSSQFSNTAVSICINGSTGDVYVGFGASGLLIYDSTLLDPQSLSITSFQMEWNDFEDSMYICSSGSVTRINGTSLVTNTYTAVGVGSTSRITVDLENESVYVSSPNFVYHIDNNSISSLSITGVSDLIFNNLTSSVDIINGDIQSILVGDNSQDWITSGVGNGYLSLNQFDGNIYISTSTDITVVNSSTGFVEGTISGNSTTRLVYNPDRRSIWLIDPTAETVIEILSNLSATFNADPLPVQSTGESFYGTLDEEYEEKNYLWIHTKDYIRAPRENFNGDPSVSLIWKWYSDNVPEFFFYDFSGDQLASTGLFAYTGERPLSEVYLNKNPNRDLDKVSDPRYQQTIFNEIEHRLDYIDDNFVTSVVPNPLQLFIGYNSPEEGALRSVMQLIKREDVDFTILATPVSSYNFIKIENIEEDGQRFGRITLDDNSLEFFTDRGLKVGQHLAIFVKDVTNNRNQYISQNNGYLVRVKSVYSRSIEVDYFKSVDSLTSEDNVIQDYPSQGRTTYLSIRFKIWDKEIGRFNLYGQTEIEDPRYHIELNNIGKIISSDDVYIFKEYDIKEEGIDWVYLNQKRKEMLMMKNLIYPYIGSYKAIINAINYFGYNDLELYEYYRNINQESVDYLKLFKVEIPDIFDNTVEGWRENDFIKHTFPNSNYEDTNLFNLTFRITDREGNNVLMYTLREVQIKLQGLKYWLQNNIIPITHKILDITGRADFVGVTKIDHISRDISIFNIYQNFTPVTFKLNEAYLMPVNNGSTVYNCVLDMSVNSTDNLPDYYTISIRAYEIYREWYPFKNYNLGDRVTYYNKAYESVINDNKTNNPRKFETSGSWVSQTIYDVSDIVRYQDDVYVYTGQGGLTASVVPPQIDPDNWINVTQWRQIDLQPVDTISEWRSIDDLNPFNFTIDSNISPYLVINVNSCNGYGMNYSDRKNYEIRGILDIQELEAFSNLTSKQYRSSLPSVP